MLESWGGRQRGGVLERGRDRGEECYEGERQREGVLERWRDRGKEC